MDGKMFEWMAVIGLVNRRKHTLPIEYDKRKRISRKEAAQHLDNSIDRLQKAIRDTLGEKDDQR